MYWSNKIPEPKQDEFSDPPQTILHLEYHPKDIPRRRVCEIFTKHCGTLFEKSVADSGLVIERTVVAYSKPPCVRDLLQSAKLHQVPGVEVSTYLEG